MLNVFMKDLRAGAVFLWAIVPLYVLAGLQVLGHGRGIFWGNVVCGSVLVVGTCMLDWKNDAGLFVHSLPVTRTMVVRGRYLTAIAAGLLSLLVGAALGATGGLILLSRGGAWPRWMAGDTGLAFILAFAFVVAIYLPCHFRWGFGRGNVAAALLLAAAMLATDLAGPLVLRRLEGPAGRPPDPGLPLGQVPEGVAWMAARYGLVPSALVVLAAAAVMLWLSSEAAVRGYRRREF